MSKKVTPTGLLVLSADAPREDWLAERRNGITATDLPKIIGISAWGTAIDVWTSKLGTAEEDFEVGIGQGEAAFWGIKFEDVVARAWAEHNNVTIRRIGIIEKETQPWMRASLDRLVTGCPDGRCALEVKTRSSYKGDDWKDGVPAEELAQVEWQLLVSGLDHIHITALIGGQKLVSHVVKYEDVDQDRLVQPAKLVWEAVASGEAPRLPEANWTDAYLDQLNPVREGSLEVDSETMLTATSYDDIVQQIKVLTEKKEELKTKLVGALGSNDTATFNGKKLYSYTSSTSRRLDSKKLIEFHPEVETDERLWNTTTTRTLRVSTVKDK